MLLLGQSVKCIWINLVYLVVVQGESGHSVQPREGPVVEDGDVVLPEVEVVQLSQMSECHCRDVLQLIVGQN